MAQSKAEEVASLTTELATAYQDRSKADRRKDTAAVADIDVEIGRLISKLNRAKSRKD